MPQNKIKFIHRLHTAGLAVAAAIYIFTLNPAYSSSAAPSPSPSQTVTKNSIVNATDFRDLRPMIQPIRVQKVINGNSFLGSDNQIYRLMGIDIPNPDSAESLEATNALTALIEGKPLRGYMTKNSDTERTNRLNQILLHATTKDNLWVQGFMIENGFARVTPTNTTPLTTTLLLGIENTARLNKKNIWNSETTRLISSDEAQNHLNSYQVVEGTVLSSATMRNQLYLNFGVRGQSDWRKDFTIGINPTLRKAIARKNINLMEMQNAKIRVRGWVQSYNGPYIEIESPEQIELIEKGRALPTGAITTPKVPTATIPVIQKPIPPNIYDAAPDDETHTQ